jgi:dienelactone hydrolase
MSSKKSSWTYKGTPLPFVPVAKPEEGWFTDVVANYYRAGLREHPEAEKTAAIPVERMQCALLLTSGGRDNVWPSARMATALVQRLRGASYAYHVEHLEFPDAGHAVFNYPPTLPAEFEVEKNGEASLFGGTPQANHDAQTATWKATLAFFQNHLK